MNTLTKKALVKNNWPLLQQNGLTYTISPLLKDIELFHIFTTRLGGSSEAPLDSFNLGRHWQTEESRIDAMNNRNKLCQSFNLNPNELAVPGQKHTNNIEFIAKDKILSPGPLHYQNIDALLTDKVNQPIMLHFADCVPIILFDTKKKLLAVIHAGWRGTADSIVSKSLEFMIQELDSKATDIHAAIGPAIGPCCYETDFDVVQKLCQTVSCSENLIIKNNEKILPDLKAFNAMQLLDRGVEYIDITSWCTSCHSELFYSHRQSGGRTGRQGALACL